MSGIVKGLKPPYFAVIFTARRTAAEVGYGEMAEPIGMK